MNERLSNMANRTSRTPKKEEAFFDALRDGRSISAACLEAGITRSSAYLWRESDPQFKAKWNECVEEGTDRLEDEAIRRARDGTEKPVYQGGVLVVYRPRFVRHRIACYAARAAGESWF